MLRAAALPAPKEVVTWAERLVSGCRDLISVVLPLTAAEREFIERLNDRGEIAPELVTGDAAMQATLRTRIARARRKAASPPTP